MCACVGKRVLRNNNEQKKRSVFLQQLLGVNDTLKCVAKIYMIAFVAILPTT